MILQDTTSNYHAVALIFIQQGGHLAPIIMEFNKPWMMDLQIDNCLCFVFTPILYVEFLLAPMYL